MQDTARDLMGTFLVEKRLAELREAIMAAVVGGHEPPALDAGEAAITAELRQRFYPDDAAFDGRTQQLTEQALHQAHRALHAVPFVGQPGFADEAAR